MRKRLRMFLTERYKGITGRIELRCFPFKKNWGTFKRRWYGYNEIDKLVSDILDFNKQKKYNICLGAHSRLMRSAKKGSGKNKDVKEITALFVDFDTYELPNRDKEDALRLINEFPLKPSIIVNSGHGMHLYWQLKKPIRKQDVPNYGRYQKGLARCFGFEKAVIDYARIMRCPYTYNLKGVLEGGKPVRTSCRHNTKNNKLIRYNLNEFDFCLDFVDEKLDKEIRELKTLEKKDVNIESLYVPDNTKEDIKNGTKKGERSELDLSVILSLLKWGCDEDIIYSIFTNSAYGISSKYTEHQAPDAYLRHSIKKAYQFANSHAKEMILDVLTSSKVKAPIINRAIAGFIYNVLRQKGIGSFYKTEIGDKKFDYYYFDNMEKSLVRIHERDDSINIYLGNKFGINPAEKSFD